MRKYLYYGWNINNGTLCTLLVEGGVAVHMGSNYILIYYFIGLFTIKSY